MVTTHPSLLAAKLRNQDCALCGAHGSQSTGALCPVQICGRVNPGAADQPPGNMLLINQTTAALRAPARGAGQAGVLHPVSPAPPCWSARNGALPPWGPSEPHPSLQAPDAQGGAAAWSFWNPVRHLLLSMICSRNHPGT